MIKKMTQKSLSDRRLGIILITPTIFTVGLLVIYPLITTVYLSFQKYNVFLGDQSRFIGISNYLELLRSPIFWNALKNGFIFTSSSIGLSLIFGILVALLLNQNFKGNMISRSLILLPYILPTVSIVLVWRWMLDPINGILNYIFVLLGITKRYINWFGIDYALISVIIANAWKYFPFITISVLAALQSIPDTIYDAAKVDGAGTIKTFFSITLPQIKSVLMVLIILRFMWNFSNFDLIWLFTKGGPAGSTETLPIMTYIQSFALLRMGFGCAIGILIMIILVIFYLVLNKIKNICEK